MSTAKFCIKHRVTTLLAVIMIVIFGGVFTTQLQMALRPDMEAPMAMDAMAEAERKRRSAPLRSEVLRLLAVSGSAAASDLCYFTGASSRTPNIRGVTLPR